MKEHSNTKTTSLNLLFYRQQLKLTKKQMAEKLGLNPTTYFYYESGEREPNLDKLREIAQILQITVDDLLTSSNPSNDSKWIKELSNVLTRTRFRIVEISEDTATVANVNGPSIIGGGTAPAKVSIDAKYSKRKIELSALRRLHEGLLDYGAHGISSFLKDYFLETELDPNLNPQCTNETK